MLPVASVRPLRAIGFDLGDTLVEYEGVPLNWEAHYPEALSLLAAHLAVNCTAGQIASAGAVLRRYDTRLAPRTHEVPFACILADLAPCLGATSIPDELGCATAFFRVFRQRLRCFPDTLPALAGLRSRGVKLGALTDVPYGMPRQLVLEDLHLAGLTHAFDVLLTSLDVGFRKPAVATLEHLSRTLGCVADDMAYVGNEKKDVDVARAFGCRAVLLNRNGTDVDWGQDTTIRSLSEL